MRKFVIITSVLAAAVLLPNETLARNVQISGTHSRGELLGACQAAVAATVAGHQEAITVTTSTLARRSIAPQGASAPAGYLLAFSRVTAWGAFSRRRTPAPSVSEAEGSHLDCRARLCRTLLSGLVLFWPGLAVAAG